jgi:hypothetical protein
LAAEEAGRNTSSNVAVEALLLLVAPNLTAVLAIQKQMVLQFKVVVVVLL